MTEMHEGSYAISSPHRKRLVYDRYEAVLGP